MPMWCRAIVLTVCLTLAGLAVAAQSLRSRLEHLASLTPVPLTTDSLRSDIAANPASDIEGIWLLTKEGAEIAVTRINDNATQPAYLIRLIDSPDRLVASGTVLGIVSRSAAPDSFDGYMFTRFDSEGHPEHPSTFTLKIHADNTMTFTLPRSKYRINIFGLLPAPLRHLVRQRDSGYSQAVGALRLFPASHSKPLVPHTL